MNITLNDFERRLEPAQFRRIHRSHIVNVNHIQLIETYDRRLLLRLSDGSKIIASREGTKNLRDLVQSN
jgi:two-component system LytT family response regulator